MIKYKKILCLIIARGRSKRLKNKNMCKINGKPLIYWTLKEAKKSKYIDEICINSDSNKILNYCKKANIKIVIKRPFKLSLDKSDKWETVKFTYNYLKARGIVYDYILLLQPTSPLRKARHIDECIKKIKNNKIDGLISVCKTECPREWTSTINKKKNYSNFKKGIMKYKKEVLKGRYLPSYRPNGSMIIFKSKLSLKKNFIFNKKFKIFEMERKYSIDIDNKIDLFMAEKLLKYKKLDSQK
tara:strand:- start:120 stop:845 length:726 start_codon:yes stop_codon:yes gene_type:complete